MSEWLETCEACDGKGCAACRQQGYVAHLCPTTEEGDDVAVLIAQDDQLRAELTRDAQIAAHFRESLIDNGFTEEGAERIANSFYQAWIYE